MNRGLKINVTHIDSQCENSLEENLCTIAIRSDLAIATRD